MLDAKRGDTIEKFVAEYAPSSENDTDSYVKHMINSLGVSKDTPLMQVINTQGIEAVTKAIAEKEDASYFNKVIKPLLARPLPTATKPKVVQTEPKKQTQTQPVVKSVQQTKPSNFFNNEIKNLPPRPLPTVNPSNKNKTEESTLLDDVSNNISNGFNFVVKNIETVPEMLSRAWVKYGAGDAAKDRTETVENRVLNTVPLKEKKKEVEQPKITPVYQEFGKTKEGYFSYVNLFDNSKGFNYVPTARIEKDSTYSGVQGMAHFLFDFDLTSEKPADNSNTKTLHSKIKYKEDGSIDSTSLKTHKTNQPGSSVTEPYYTVYRKNDDGTVNIKYKKADEIIKGDKIADDLRQYRYTDINWKSAVQAPSFNKTISTLATNDNQPTYFIFAKGLGKNAYGKYGGGSVVYLIEGTNIAIDFAGSLAQIQTQAETLIKQFKIDPKQLIIAYHDLGSYSAKPDDVDNKISSRRYYGFNTNKQTGAGLAIPK
jgi:hypothetical protein